MAVFALRLAYPSFLHQLAVGAWRMRETKTHHLTQSRVACTATVRFALLWMPAILCQVFETVSHVEVDV